ncbi:hypothetical protein Ancab_023867 [Ancistrocladus abbreviatus]
MIVFDQLELQKLATPSLLGCAGAESHNKQVDMMMGKEPLASRRAPSERGKSKVKRKSVNKLVLGVNRLNLSAKVSKRMLSLGIVHSRSVNSSNGNTQLQIGCSISNSHIANMNKINRDQDEKKAEENWAYLKQIGVVSEVGDAPMIEKIKEMELRDELKAIEINNGSSKLRSERGSQEQ